MYDRGDGAFRAARVPTKWSSHDFVQLGEPARLSAAAEGGAAILRRRPGDACCRRLSLAGAAVDAPDVDRAPRLERIERRALHARTCRQSVRARHERGPAEPAPLPPHG